MSEYIEKQAAVDALGKQPEVYSWEDALMREQWDLDKAAIEAIPPADVRPVVRGRWIPFTSEAAGDIWYCSACDIGFAHHMDFCPHCGADMREDKP